MTMNNHHLGSDSLSGSFSIRIFTANASWPQGFCPKKNIHFLIQGPLFRNVVFGKLFRFDRIVDAMYIWTRMFFGRGAYHLSSPPRWGITRFGLHPPGKVTWLAGRLPPWMKMHFLLKMGDFSASHVSFQVCTTFLSFVFELRKWLG